ncbi:glycosyltransferase [Glaciimonas sp. PAMC28666]|uniref:glycosyltransferase n=1 Tax=Glaciimonas sp. PAMC28666 TaxID=2807626 RepID=UPI001963E9B5|nr:glycosyltransferase [Glaciimonas sp. PAMC28666]QRX81009.1 glycosyltransferase [Glaciimonas sp. PAMC28666]
MTHQDIINSDLYWDSRFAENWEEHDGPRQSRFFASLAIEHLPFWLVEQLKRNSLTLADWGCAQGDGTDVWASYIDATQITGVDFSAVAIDQANQRYPSIRFINEDWLVEGSVCEEMFDVVFSSNTLEHFHKPYVALNSICQRAKKAIVLALPYKEMERIDEHFFSFLPENIPLRLANGFRLIWSRVVDCRKLQNTRWSGDQVILAYVDTNWIDNLRLTLSDCHIAQLDAIRISIVLEEREREKADLQKEMAEWRTEAKEFFNWWSEQQVNTIQRKGLIKIGETQQQIYVRQLAEVKEIFSKQKQINALQQLELMKISDWATSIDSAPIAYAARKYGRILARALYKSLPLSLNVKQKLRSNLMRLKPLSPSTVSLSNSLNTARINSFNENSLLLGQGKERDVFVFSVIDWHFRIQRPQQLARSFAKAGSRVFFFSNHFIDSVEPGYDIEQLDPLLPIYQIKLHVRGAPAIYFAPPTSHAEIMIEASMARFVMDFAALSSLSIIQHAYWYPLVLRLPNTYRVYDCMDHHEGFGNVPEELIEIEKNMLQRSDLVVVTSSWLESFARESAQNIAVVRNACEYEHFADSPEEVYVDTNGRKIIGYYGAIAEWFDLEIIRAIAAANPDDLILLVGNDTAGASLALKDIKNIVFTGEVAYSKLPFYLHAFDVCILPFKVIPLTLATNPVKIYEYLAAGKLVVSVDLPEIAQFGDLVQRAKSVDEFVELVTKAKTSYKVDPSRESERKAFGSQQTWDHRVAELDVAIKSLALPKISVVVLTYNNLDLTIACLVSLVEKSDYPNLEIIVVDNASIDETRAYLATFLKNYPSTKVILNDDNLGFAAGNNVGLAAATGDYLVMLNNDTVVTQGWAMTLMRHLQADKSIGLIGPVTNNIGNEARIETSYKQISDMPVEAFNYTLSKMGDTFAIKNAAFFCVMMQRLTYEACGPLSEEYGLGFFEDDDYCRRVEASGLKILCARDVFIHHQLSASFNKLPSKDKEALIERNKAIYERKWGPWIPHSYRIEKIE